MNHVDYVYDIVVDEAWGWALPLKLKWSNGRNKWLCWIKFLLEKITMSSEEQASKFDWIDGVLDKKTMSSDGLVECKMLSNVDISNI